MYARIISLLIAGIDIAIVTGTRKPSTATDSLDFINVVSSSAPTFVIFGVLAVWGADYLSEFKGPTSRGGYVDTPTPAALFVGFGFLFLSLPIAGFVVRFLFLQ